jgi:hypothetical protein
MKKNNIITFLPKFENLLKPLPAKKLLPEWYKNQNSYTDIEEATIKKCMPIFDAMTFGYFLLSQSNITIDSTNKDKLSISTDNNFDNQIFKNHSFGQYSKYKIPLGYHSEIIRIHPMWCIKTPNGYSSLFLNPIHHESKDLIAIDGLIDTDNFISDGHLSFFVKSNSIFTIKKGTPLIQVIPFKRETWNMDEKTVEETKTIIKSENDLGLIKDGRHNLGAYKNIFHVKKMFD